MTLTAAALAACISTTLVMHALTKACELGEMTLEVDYDRRLVATGGTS